MSKQALVVHIALIAFAAIALWVRSAAGAEPAIQQADRHVQSSHDRATN